jgi:hypothetical protein
MKKSLYLRVALLIAGIIFLSLVVISLSVQHFNNQVQPTPVYSPSGERVILPSINYNQDDSKKYLCVKLVVQDVDTGTNLFEIQTGASNRMRWSVDWIDENTIQLTSSDIGIYCWAEKSEGVWQEWECPQ